MNEETEKGGKGKGQDKKRKPNQGVYIRRNMELEYTKMEQGVGVQSEIRNGEKVKVNQEDV